MPYRRGATVVQQPQSPWANMLGGLGSGFAGGIGDYFQRKEREKALVAQVLEKFDPAFLATDYGQLIGESLGLGGSPILQSAGEIGARQLGAAQEPPAYGPSTAAPPPTGGPPILQETPPAQLPPAAMGTSQYSPEAPIPVEAYTEYKKAQAQELAINKLQTELYFGTEEEKAKAMIEINAKEIERGQEFD